MKKKRYFLDLLLKEEIVEGQPEHFLFSRKARTALQHILEALSRATKDPKIVALSLTIKGVASGWARLSDLRRALIAFRQSGKPIYCFMQEGGNAEYYLASACDQIFMPPAANLQLVGLSAEVFFLRDALDWFGIEPQLQSIGEYKSAAEILTRKSMSNAAREQLEALLDDNYEELCSALGSRGFGREEVAARIDSGPYTVREAMKQNLLDGICYQDEVVDKLKQKLGNKLVPLPAGKYFAGDGFFKRLLTFRRPRIAIINVLGHIDSGESRRGRTGQYITGAETIGQFLDHAKEARRTRAIVLRIDSPGGSGLASDILWRKISLVVKSKPIVVSFGDVAASGGYYIAVPASCIFAESTSITGSIGVLGGKLVARELMSRLAVNRESIHRGEHAEYESLFSGFTQAELEKLNRQLHEFYREDFVKKVAEGRKMDEAAVDQVGRGRIWSGKRAKENKLVDRIGGLFEAIQEARKLAHIPDSKKVRIVHYYPHRRLWERLVPDFRTSVAAGFLPQPAIEALDAMEKLCEQGILLLMPFKIRIR